MVLFINQIISSVIQIIIFSIVPFIWWLCSARKQHTFFQWIGLHKTDAKKDSKLPFWIAFLSLVFMLLGIVILYVLKDVETATSEFTGMGVQAIPAILIYAIFHTSLSEELLFRGFLLKRLSNRFGFYPANFIQSTLFALLHGIMFFSLVSAIESILIIVFTGAIAWFMGYTNESKANGSIIPSWIIHSVSNFVSGICYAFLLF